MANVFFKLTKSFLNSITEQFHFVHPLRASMLYTKNAVAKIAAKHPNADDNLFKSYIDPNDCIHGVGYRKAFINTPWAEQEEQLAWLLLNNLFAIHEGWAQSIFLERFKGKGYSEKFVSFLESTELPLKLSSYYVTPSKRSTLLTNAFYNVYKTASQLDFSKLDHYMLMYRYFKEARNCFMHNNCIASSRLVNAYNDYCLIATQANLDVTEVPVVIPPILNSKAHLSIRGVIGFSDFVQRILIISDIALLQTIAAEDEFLIRLCEQRSEWQPTLSTNITRARDQMGQICLKAGFLRPAWSEEFQHYMISHKFVCK